MTAATANMARMGAGKSLILVVTCCRPQTKSWARKKRKRAKTPSHNRLRESGEQQLRKQLPYLTPLQELGLLGGCSIVYPDAALPRRPTGRLTGRPIDQTTGREGNTAILCVDVSVRAKGRKQIQSVVALANRRENAPVEREGADVLAASETAS